MAYNPIPNNPYIVGNPIQNSNMFYGRNEDFLYIKDKLEKETKGLIITLAGERRSGKTSILFQIMNGRLGEEYIPFFIDMQAMAAVESDAQFLARMDTCIRQNLKPDIPAQDYAQNCWKTFEDFLDKVAQQNPGKKFVFLIDEYELVEYKIEKNLISEELITFFANLMENRSVYFVFTGSNKLEERQTLYWKTLFSKSQYRKITFLKHNDCLALITKPLEGYVNYTEEQQEKIWRLTAGQPFYTQIFCQNMVDKLQIEKRNDVLEEDIDAVIADIVDNPMPQMIYFWQELDARHKLAMSLLAEVLQVKEDWADSQKLLNTLAAHKLNLAITEKDLHTALEEMYHRDILSKKGNEYQFRVDIFRFWVKQEQNVWKLLRELNLEKPVSSSRPYKYALLGVLAVLIVATGLAFWLFKPKPEFGDTKNGEARKLYRQANTYYEDANYSLALKNVKAAIVADSLYFKACLLKADILKAMNNDSEALPAYERAERLYYKLTGKIGDLLSPLPDSLAAENAKSNWDKQGEFIFDSQYIRNNYYIQISLPPKEIISDLHAFHLKTKKWINLPGATFLYSKGSIIYCYNFKDNSVSAYNARAEKTLWNTKLPELDTKYRYFNTEALMNPQKSKFLVIYGRKLLAVLDTKTGKLVSCKQYRDYDLNFVEHNAISNRLLVCSEKDRIFYRLPDLKLEKTFSSNTPGQDIYFKIHGNMFQVSNKSLYRTEIWNYFPKDDSLELIANTTQSSDFSLLKKALFYTENDSLHMYELATGKRSIIKMRDNQAVKSLYSFYIPHKIADFAYAFGDSNLFILNQKGSVLHQIPLAKLSEKGEVITPDMVAYDAKRKRIVYTTFVGEDAKSEARTLCVFDIRKGELLYTVNISKSYRGMDCLDDLYVLWSETVDFDRGLYYSGYDAMLMNPEGYQIMPLSGLKLLNIDKNRIMAIADKKLYQLSVYPTSEEKSLQRIHENLIQLYNSSRQPDKILPVFRRMLVYLRSYNNLSLSQIIAENLANYAGEDLGYFASRLMTTDANFNAIKPRLSAAMNLSVNNSLTPIKLDDREYIRTYGDLLYTMKYSQNWAEITYSSIRNGKKEPMFRTLRVLDQFHLDEGIYVSNLPNQKPVLHIWDKTGRLFSYPLPTNPKLRTAMGWLNDDMVYYVTMKQRGKTFDYELSYVEKASGQRTIHKTWNSPLHLRSVVTYDDSFGLAFSDSVEAVYYAPTEQAAFLPALAQVVRCNGKPVTKVDDLNPSLAEEFDLEYLYNGMINRIVLSPAQLAGSLFCQLMSTRLQWFDLKTKEFGSPVQMGYVNSLSNYIGHYGKPDNIFGRYLTRWNGSDSGEIFMISDLVTGKITATFGFKYSAELDIDFNYSVKDAAFLSRIGLKQQNRIECSYRSFSPEGHLVPIWTVSLPWKAVYIMDSTGNDLILYAYRELDSGDYSFALLYLDRRTGELKRTSHIAGETAILTFENKSLMLYNPQLGFLDPIPPAELAGKKR